jgi:SH3-like domain-containing protein
MPRVRSSGRSGMGCALRTVVAAVAVSASVTIAWGADFMSTSGAVTILYDAPSAKAKPLFILGADTPLEVIVPVEGWTKVRDAGGTIGWVEKGHLAARRMLVVRVPVADVRANPDDDAPIVFRAENGVLLELAEPAASAAETTMPGWVKVRHRDGQSGFVRIAQVFGL